MRRPSTIFFACIFAFACAAAPAASPFEFQPSVAPHRYEVNVSGDIVAETPMGRMMSETESDATVLLDIGEPLADGWNVSAIYEALEVTARGNLGGGSVNADGIIGNVYSGALSRAGSISITDSPETTGRLADNLDPAALFTELLVPLPPLGNAQVEPWPVAWTVVSDAAVRLVSVFEGTARFAGDTVWEGIPARLIVAEGSLEIEGAGAPAGAPAEIDMVLAGESTRLYVWDTVRRVMLASLYTGEADGTLSLRGMNLSIPARFVKRQEVKLRR